MALENVYLVSRRLTIVPEEDLDQLESDLGFPLPAGYREYLRILGDGQFCHSLRVYIPSKVTDLQEREYWTQCLLPTATSEGFWDARRLLSDDELRSSYVFAHSDEGDHFIACPQRVGELFELPRHEDRMHHYPQGFLEPFRFEFCRISKYNLPFFEPPNSRQAELRLNLKRGVDSKQIWDYLKELLMSPMQVAEGEIGATDRVIAFLPTISGCAWFENNKFYFFAAAEHAPVLHQIRQKFANCAKS